MADAGLKVWNDSSYIQIDNTTSYFVLIGKGTAISASYPTNVNNCSGFTVPVADGQLCAIADSAPWTIAGKTAGSWVYRTTAPAGTAFTYYIFGPYTPSGITVGMRLRDPNGTVIYDTGRLPLRVATDVAGIGTFSLPAGRSYALVPWQLDMWLSEGIPPTGAPGQGGNPLPLALTSGFATLSGSTVSIAMNMFWMNYKFPNRPDGSLPSGWNWATHPTNNLDNKYTVLDVTGY